MSTIAVKKVKLGDNADTSKNFLIEVPAVADGTLTIKREDGTAVLSIAADGKAVIPGVVGTVAQVGGIPTGQVVERGSNANGTYVRFADGTQICTGSVLYTNDVTNATGSLFMSASQDFSLPAAFTSVSARCAYSPSFGGTWLTGESGVGAGAIRIRAMRAASTTTDFTVEYFVIGRWF